MSTPTEVSAFRIDATLTESPEANDPLYADRDCCLVQIYPANMIDGMRPMECGSLVVGRDAKCGLHLEDSSVSRRHAELTRVADTYEITDLNSTNGTLVNGEPITTHLLQAGDCIKIGSYLFKFLSAGSIETVYHETVYSAMTTDALTGAFNKNYLLDNLAREIARSQRHLRPLAVVMCDIDRFKSVNDTYGHLVGDEVLKEFGRRLAAVCREDDLFARYGGEEFSVVLSETELDEALDMAERFRAAVATEPFETNAGPLEVTSSFGVSTLDDAANAKPNDLIRVADERLYGAKQAGRNRVIGPSSRA